MAEDPYSVLGVGRGAPMDEVRKSYRRLAKQFHPDRNPGDKAAEERFKKLSAAFTFLEDDTRRGRYDRGEIDADGNPRFAGFGGGGAGRGPFGGGDPFGPGGPFAGAGRSGGRSGPGQPEFEEFFGDLFGAAFRGGAARPGFEAAGRGADLRASLEVAFVDAVRGGKSRIEVAGRRIDVTIPPGVETGRTLKLAGQGERGAGGVGDLLVTLKVLPHPQFRREGDTVLVDHPVSLAEALDGAKVTVPTPAGPVAVTVPAGANSGTVLRVRGRGVNRPGAPGDLHVRLTIALPEGDNTELAGLLAGWSRRDEAPKR